jgi:hypothetical protein
MEQFDHLLKRKLERKLPTNFDQEFQRKFQAELPLEISKPLFPRFVLAGAALAAIVLVLFLQIHPGKSDPMLAEILQNKEFYANYEMFNQLDYTQIEPGEWKGMIQ